MIEFNSLIALKNYVPIGEHDKIAKFKYRDKAPKIYFWDDCWIEKAYWTIKEVADFIGEPEDAVIAATIKVERQYKYLSSHRMKRIVITWNMIAPIKHMIEQTKTVNV